jgi:hypothetical protein
VKRLFQPITANEWEAARKPVRQAFPRTTKHADIYQALAYLRGREADPMAKITVAPEALEKKRKVLLEYAARLDMNIQTMVGVDGSLFVRNRRRRQPRRADVPPPERLFQAVTAQEWREYVAQNKRRVA